VNTELLTNLRRRKAGTTMRPLLERMRCRVNGGGAADRGDVPGWVLITVMTAGLVTALWLVAQPQLTSLFQSAIQAVHGP